MAKEIDTGMDKQDMKRLLMKSKTEPVNCAFALGEEPTTALLLLDRVKQPKGVEQTLNKQFTSAKNTRFGTAFVDTEVDAKKVLFRINKPISGVARKLAKTLKGTGFTKIEILLEDGTLVESHSEEEEEALEKDGEDSATTQTAGAPPPPPPMPPQANRPDAGELARTLAELIKRIPGVVAVTPALKADLARMATDANVNLKTNNLVTAAAMIEALAEALDGAPQGPAPMGTGAPTTTPPKAPEGAVVAYAKSRLAWLAARKRMESDIEKLRGEIVTTYKQEGIADKLDAAYRQRVAPVLTKLDDSLADKLDEATNATDPTKRAGLVTDARTILEGYQAFLASDDTLKELDANPFVPLQIRATIAGTLDALSKAVH